MLAGAVVGGALGVAAGMLLASGPAGKKLGKESAQFYAHLAPRMKKMKRMGQKEYAEFVKNAAKSYGKTKRLSVKEQKMLVANATKSWKHLKRHLPK